MRSAFLAFLLLAAPALSLAPGPEDPEPMVWMARLPGRSAPAAVALDPRSGRLAVGDARGVLVGAAASGFAAVATRASVRALSFEPGGRLLVGTEDGLFVLDEGGALEDRSPGTGEEARRIERIASVEGMAAAATPAGVFVTEDLRAWRRLPGPREAVAVALRLGGAAVEVVCVAAGDVLTASLAVGAGTAPALWPLPGLDAAVRASARDVHLGADGDLLIVTAERLVHRPADGEAFRVLRPALPPGASMQRVSVAAGRTWLATDRGLLSAVSPEAPFVRAGSASAGAPVHDVTGDSGRVFAATASGLVEGAVALPPTPPDALLREARLALEFPARNEPSVQAVFRAALDHLDLRPDLLRDLRRGLAVRGLLPELAFRLERSRSSEGERSRDEAFVSGDLRRLHDGSTGSSRETVASVTLAWDLGGLAYDSDAVDLSREARSVIQLRDDVLDEIAQLYFERRRVLLQLAALGPAAAGDDAERLRLRADELAAGLDAWTGGWFGRHAPPLAP